jgi:hypothetical protein
LGDKNAWLNFAFSLIVPLSVSLTILLVKTQKQNIFQRFWFWLILIPVSLAPFITIESEPDVDPTTQSIPSIEESATEKPEIVLSEKEIFISDAVSGGMSEAAAAKVYEFMAEILFCENISFIGQAPVGNALWEISASSFRYNIAADADGIYSVRCGDYLVFDGDKVLLTVEDLQLRSVSGYETYYAVIAKEIVSSYLKSSATADFAPIYDFKMKRCGDLVMVSAYVDAQNSFGAMIRNEWIVEFRTIDLEKQAFEYEIVYVKIGNDIAGEFIEIY